jgi:molybdopterin biosynthesis enzyme
MPEAFRRLKRRSVAEVISLWTAGGAPLDPVTLPLAEASGAVLAEPVHVPGPLPAAAIAEIDGVAVMAFETIGASPYLPAELSASLAVRAGDVVPAPFDAVAPAGDLGVDTSVAPGANLRRIGENATAGMVLLPAGRRLGARALAVAAASGLTALPVRRARVALRTTRPEAPAAMLLAGLLSTGCAPDTLDISTGNSDIILFVGGAAIGAHDPAYRAAEAAGFVPFGPVAVTPGGTMLAGTLDDRPALIVADGAADGLAAALALVRPLLAALEGATDTPPSKTLPLARKISSAVGRSELVLLAESDGAWSPLALDLTAIASAIAFAVLPPESEGRDAGTRFTAFLFADAL